MHKLAVGIAIIGLFGAVACKPTVTGSSGDDGGAACGNGEKLVNGECRFVCSVDGECATGQRCNLLLGQCEAKACVLTLEFFVRIFQLHRLVVAM